MNRERNFSKNLCATIIVICIILLFLFSGCKTRIQYVPVESVKTEYKDRLIKDSVHILDSVFIYSKNDTVFFNKYNTVYKDKLRVDTICRIDTITKVQTVNVPGKTEYKYPKWLILLSIIGAFSVGFGIYKLYIRFK